MKYLFFFFAFIPALIQAQDYRVEITPQGNNFQVLLVDKECTTPPCDGRIYNDITEAELLGLAYQYIAQKKQEQAIYAAQSFLADLNEDDVIDSVDNYVVLDYSAYASARFTNAFNGSYQYQIVGGGVNVPITIQGSDLRNANNNNLLGTVTPVARNWFSVTAASDGEVIQLYEIERGYFAGRNALGQVVSLTKQ